MRDNCMYNIKKLLNIFSYYNFVELDVFTYSSLFHSCKFYVEFFFPLKTVTSVFCDLSLLNFLSSTFKIVN
jgi:hypothetical protein